MKEKAAGVGEKIRAVCAITVLGSNHSLECSFFSFIYRRMASVRLSEAFTLILNALERIGRLSSPNFTDLKGESTIFLYSSISHLILGFIHLGRSLYDTCIT